MHSNAPVGTSLQRKRGLFGASLAYAAGSDLPNSLQRTSCSWTITPDNRPSFLYHGGKWLAESEKRICPCTSNILPRIIQPAAAFSGCARVLDLSTAMPWRSWGRPAPARARCYTFSAHSIAPQRGDVRLEGTRSLRPIRAQLADFRNRHIGFVFQDHHLLPQCSVLENVLIPTWWHRQT